MLFLSVLNVLIHLERRRPVYDRFRLSGQKATVRAGGGEIPEPDPEGSTGARLQNALCAAAGHGIIDQPQHHPASYMQLEQEGLIYPVKGTGNFIADSEEVRKLSKASYTKELKAMIQKGKAMGMNEEELIYIIGECYRRRRSMIEVKECSKAFGTVKAVNKATLDVGVREVFGLVGSNGAGKSTLAQLLHLEPDRPPVQRLAPWVMKMLP